MKKITEEIILQALSHVDDPDLKKDIVTLGMVKDVRIEEGKVGFSVVLTTPACPMKELIKNACINAVKHLVDSSLEVDVFMTSKVTSTRDEATVLPGVKNIIAVASGKGGVGKSTVSCNLAVALARKGARVGLLDADIYGPSMPLMMGLRDAQPEMRNVNGKDLIIPIEKFGIKVLSIGFMVPAEQAIVWRGPMLSSVIRQFVNDVDWGNLDYLVIDMPPGTGDVHLTLSQLLPLTGVVMVTTPQEVALADARKAAAMFNMPMITFPILGVVENMSWFTPSDAPDKKYHIFGSGGGMKLSEELSVPLLGQIPVYEEIREAGDEGVPVMLLNGDHLQKNAIADFAEQLARQVAIQNASAVLAGTI